MPFTKKKAATEAEVETAPAQEEGASRLASLREFVMVPRATRAIDETHRQLDTLRADYATTVAEQLRLETARKDVPATVYKNRAVLEQKIADAEREIVAVATAAAEDNYAAGRAEWNAIQRQRALLVLSLRQTNKALEAKKRSFKAGGYLPGVHGDGFTHRLFGFRGSPGVSGLAAEEYLRQAVHEGFLTAKELADDV